MAEAALMAVRILRRAILSSRDHFMMGQHSCRSDPGIKGLLQRSKGLDMGRNDAVPVTLA